MSHEESKEQIARLEARIVEIEGLFTHQQKLIQDLNDVIIDQQRRLDRCESHAARLSARTESLLASMEETPRTLEDDKPPHY